jgi:hypothetical protein
MRREVSHEEEDDAAGCLGKRTQVTMQFHSVDCHVINIAFGICPG